MRFGKIFLASALALVIFGSTAAWAVGYEKRYTKTSPRVGAMGGTAYREHVMDKLNEASMIDRYPVIIEDFASTVKDILSQFGLTDKSIP